MSKGGGKEPPAGQPTEASHGVETLQPCTCKKVFLMTMPGAKGPGVKGQRARGAGPLA